MEEGELTGGNARLSGDTGSAGDALATELTAEIAERMTGITAGAKSPALVRVGGEAFGDIYGTEERVGGGA